MDIQLEEWIVRGIDSQRDRQLEGQMDIQFENRQLDGYIVRRIYSQMY